MKKKTISRVVQKKMTSWLNSIEDTDLRNKLRPEIIVTGGSIVSMFLQEKVNDFDVYIETPDICKRLVDYYLSKAGVTDVHVIVDDDRVQVALKNRDGFAKIGKKEDKESGKYVPLFFTENSITLSDDVQIVTRFTGKAEEIHKNYDFVHATNYWTYESGLVLNNDALVSILTKELIYTGSKYPICSIIRSKKFIQRGWTINAGQYLKMCMQVSDLDLRSINVLKDQIIGVDVAYFMELLQKLEKESTDLKDIDLAHIMELISDVFDNEQISDFVNETVEEVSGSLDEVTD